MGVPLLDDQTFHNDTLCSLVSVNELSNRAVPEATKC